MNLAAASRNNGDLAVGVSPQASTALMRACQAWAAFAGLTFVVPEDIQELAPYFWGHRVVAGSGGESPEGRDVIRRLLESVPVPL